MATFREQPAMTATVNIHEAKTHFSKLIERVRLGEEIIIAKAGEPVARLVPEACPGKPTQAWHRQRPDVDL